MGRDQMEGGCLEGTPHHGQMIVAGDSVAVMIPKVGSSNTVFCILSYCATQEPSMILALCIKSKGFAVTF